MTTLHDALTNYVYNELANIPPSGGAVNIRDDFRRGYCIAAETITRELEALLNQHKSPEADHTRYQTTELIKRLVDLVDGNYYLTKDEIVAVIEGMEKR